MKLSSIAMLVLIFSGVVAFFSALDVFNYEYNAPGYEINQSEVSGIFEVTEPMVEEKSVLDSIFSSIGLGFVPEMLHYAQKIFGYAINMGGLVQQYVPGDVGVHLGTLVNAITYFVYVWGAIQIFLKVSGKSLE